MDVTWKVWELGAKRLSLELGHDQVQVTDPTGAPLPRIPAQRWRLAAAWSIPKQTPINMLSFIIFMVR